MAVTPRKTVPTSSTAQKLAAASGGSTGTRKQLQVSSAALPPPVETEDLDISEMADFYRDGSYDEETGELLLRPRELTPLVNHTASIRVFGTGTGSDIKYEKGQRVQRDFIPPYTKFIISSVQETLMEKSQVIETFGEYYVFMFGEKPPMFSFSGVLINSQRHNWVSDFAYYYRNFLRGTKCVERNARAILSYGGRWIEGYILTTSNTTNAETQEGVPFNFSFLVTKRGSIIQSDDFNVQKQVLARQEYQATLERTSKQFNADQEGTNLSDPSVSDNYVHTDGVLSGGRPASFFSPSLGGSAAAPLPGLGGGPFPT